MSTNGHGAASKLRIGILGASGYTGAELLRLLGCHPAAEIAFLTADRHAGEPMAKVFPQLAPMNLPDLIRIEDAHWSGADVVFCALPHGTTQDVIANLFEAAPDKKVIDLSADFRLHDLAVYAEYYGHAHKQPDLQKEAVYGLTEHYRDAVRTARLCANPGCYTTTAELPLMPLVEGGLIETGDIVIDAKSGVSGAGRSERLGNLHTEVSEGIHAYGVGWHRHTPEIEQELTRAAGSAVMVNFTPHLVPMDRGILCTIYATPTKDASEDQLMEAARAFYADKPFVRVVELGIA